MLEPTLERRSYPVRTCGIDAPRLEKSAANVGHNLPVDIGTFDWYKARI